MAILSPFAACAFDGAGAFACIEKMGRAGVIEFPDGLPEAPYAGNLDFLFPVFDALAKRTLVSILPRQRDTRCSG